MKILKNKVKSAPLSLLEKLLLTFTVASAAYLSFVGDWKFALLCLIIAVVVLLNVCVDWLWLIFQAIILKENDK